MSTPAYPFRTGITDKTYDEVPWIIGQYSGFSDPAATNRRFRDLIAGGQQGLAIALDLPTQLGLDADDPRAHGEVGRCGVSISSLRDVEALFDGIALDSVRQISTTANSIGPMMIAFILALAEKRQVDPRSFSVRLQNDVLKEYVARGTQFLPVHAGVRLVADAIEYCVAHLPRWVPISISGYHMRDAGASRERELGFTLANAREYLRGLEERGVDLTPVAKQVTWFLSASAQPLEEAAKFRAARELWATELKENFGVVDDEALKLRIIAYTLGSELLPTEILNNAVRVSLAAAGAVLGGVQTLFCSSIDEALGLPTERHALLSMRTQQILLHESGLASYLDVLGGSPVVEALTDRYRDEARRLAQEVEEQGGAAAAIANGFMRAQIDEDSWRSFQASGQKVGATEHETKDVELFGLAEDAEAVRIKVIEQFKAARSPAAVEAALARVAEAVASGANVVEPFKTAFLNDVTLGEICTVLTERFGRISMVAA